MDWAGRFAASTVANAIAASNLFGRLMSFILSTPLQTVLSIRERTDSGAGILSDFRPECKAALISFQAARGFAPAREGRLKTGPQEEIPPQNAFVNAASLGSGDDPSL